MEQKLKIEAISTSADYELLDSGEGEKLERFGKVVLSRPDPQALWKKQMTEKEWTVADAYFSRDGKATSWTVRKPIPDKWQISFADLTFIIKPTAFKHTGLFPEQASNWNWMREVVASTKKAEPTREINVLNLFGYTGGASLACAQAGAKVCHVDGSKSAITWARENAEVSGLTDAPIRWILEDVQVFVEREIKRGKKYDAVIMDPPAFGHGASKEIWKIEEHFLGLLDLCAQLLSDKPIFFVVNGYASGYSAISYKNALSPIVEKMGGTIEVGELAITESKSLRLLPCGIFARWKRG
ncbi:SAM-dependent methyltransferase [Patescibacteria group bacterium]|nr:MAG: SAM-dependent methyltransferase [Patescibacteria group bacterium]